MALVSFADSAGRSCAVGHGWDSGGGLRNPQKGTKVLGRWVQSEHVNDPAEPGLRSAERGGITLFQKGGPNIPLAGGRGWCYGAVLFLNAEPRFPAT